MLITKENQEKLKKIRDSGSFCCIKIFSDHNYIWEMELTLSGFHEKYVEHKPVIRRSDDDLDKLVEKVYKKALEYME